MLIEDTALAGVKILTPVRHGDARGFFSESWNARRMADAGLACDFVQDNHSMSVEPGTLRGLHFQSPPHAQVKLVRCSRGRLFDVAVDIRVGSPTYGRWIGEELSFDNGKQMLIPKGFMHGFVTRESNTEITYKCSDFYAAGSDRSVQWDDPDIGIDWGLTSTPILSEKDKNAPGFAELDPVFFHEADT